MRSVCDGKDPGDQVGAFVFFSFLFLFFCPRGGRGGDANRNLDSHIKRDEKGRGDTRRGRIFSQYSIRHA